MAPVAAAVPTVHVHAPFFRLLQNNESLASLEFAGFESNLLSLPKTPSGVVSPATR